MTVEDGLLDRRVRALEIGSDGHVRVGTVTGLSDVDGTRITSFTEAHGLVDDTINSLAEDRDANLWIGTDAGGAMRVAAFGLVSYFQADGLRVDYVPFLIDGGAGGMIAVSGNYFSLNEFDGRRFVPARFNVPRNVPMTASSVSFAITWVRGGSERRKGCTDSPPFITSPILRASRPSPAMPVVVRCQVTTCSRCSRIAVATSG